jgi:hypothetical protein
MESTDDALLDLPPDMIGDSKLNLGDRKLERLIEELASAPPKLHALRDEVFIATSMFSLLCVVVFVFRHIWFITFWFINTDGKGCKAAA